MGFPDLGPKNAKQVSNYDTEQEEKLCESILKKKTKRTVKIAQGVFNVKIAQGVN